MDENRVQPEETAERQKIISCLETMLVNQKKSQLRQRIQLVCAVIGACALAGMLAAVILLGGQAVNRLERTAKELEDAVETAETALISVNLLAENLNEVDYAQMAANVEELTEAGTKGLEEAFGKLETTMIGAEEALQKLNALDIEGLNKGIEQLNDITTRIQNALPSWIK